MWPVYFNRCSDISVFVQADKVVYNFPYELISTKGEAINVPIWFRQLKI